MSNQSYIQKKKMVGGYETLIAEIMENENAEPYYVSFMFSHLPGGQSAQIEQMWKEVTRFHGLLKRHVVRKPAARGWKELVPVLIGVPDYPVWKHKKVRVRSLQVNDGLHFNAVVLLPPRFEFPQITYVKQSRLKVSLDVHVAEREREYLTDKLYRIDVRPIDHDTMANYTFKTLLKGRVTSDDILILNQ
jgi:hypothetical protein